MMMMMMMMIMVLTTTARCYYWCGCLLSEIQSVIILAIDIMIVGNVPVKVFPTSRPTPEQKLRQPLAKPYCSGFTRSLPTV